MSSFIEGDGVFKDFNGSEDGSPVYETKDKDEWIEYCKNKGIKQIGQGPCIICNTIVHFDNLPVGKNPVCDNCKGDLL